MSLFQEAAMAQSRARPGKQQTVKISAEAKLPQFAVSRHVVLTISS